jgi:hypothetical protein
LVQVVREELLQAMQALLSHMVLEDAVEEEVDLLVKLVEAAYFL